MNIFLPYSKIWQWTCRILLTSTSEVYGDPLVHPQDESYWGNVNPIGMSAYLVFLESWGFFSRVLLYCYILGNANALPQPTPKIKILLLKGHLIEVAFLFWLNPIAFQYECHLYKLWSLTKLILVKFLVYWTHTNYTNF